MTDMRPPESDPHQAIAELRRQLDERTAERDQAWARQAATSSLLKAISRSAFDLDTVMDDLVRAAAKLCGAGQSTLHLREADFLVVKGAFAFNEKTIEFLRQNPIRLDIPSYSREAISTGSVVNIGDAASDKSSVILQQMSRSLGYKAMLLVPLMRDDHGIGLFSLTRDEVGEFSRHEVELVQTFADQAVIAIGNARLFDETKEALDQQKASADILSVISNSVADARPVFDKILHSVAHLFGADERVIFLRADDGQLHIGAIHGPNAEQARAQFPAPLEGTATELAICERRMGVSADIFNDATIPAAARERSRRFGKNYSMAIAPMLWEDRAIGSIMVARTSMAPFTDKECSLLGGFADQAVIAVQNARLFNETREALERQTATADILKVIASSPSDVQPVFEAIADSTKRLIGCFSAAVWRLIDDAVHLVAFTPVSPEADAALRANSPVPVSELPALDLIGTGKPLHVADTELEITRLKEIARARGYRSQLLVPLMQHGQPIGVITGTRVEPGAFADHHVQLLQTFADQAVIAIENTRLFNEVQQRTHELTSSLEELRTTQDRLIQTEKLASLGQLTAGIAHEIKNPLNFVNNFAAEVDELTGLLKDNLQKVVQHGKRADSIVKNMLLHSREGSGEHRSTDINALVEESLNLAYHGARAEKPQFDVTMKRELDPRAGTAELFPQEITRVLLNLISNGFYALARRGSGLEPMLSATTRDRGAEVEIRIRDNGTGIPADVKEKMFNPFFTTKPAGEGTGLGLSLSHDIIVKQHGGTIDVDTRPGEFTEFTIRLPRKSSFVDKG